MALFKRSSKSGESRKNALQVFSDLKNQSGSVRVDIEKTPFHFYSKPVVRSGLVTMTIPSRIQPNLKDKEWVRIDLGKGSAQELRMQVAHQEPAETEGLGRFFCRLPSVSLQPKRRATLRFNTGQFKDLIFYSTRGESHRIMDMSAQGMRVRVSWLMESGGEDPADGDQHGPFKVGKVQKPGGRIQMGSRTALGLERLLPRYLGPRFVGMEYEVAGGVLSEKILTVFMDALDKEIRNISAIEPAP